MSDYIKLFKTHSEYETYIQGDGKVLPNVSFCEDQKELHYNPWVETRIVAKFNVINTSDITQIMDSSATSQFTQIEIDGTVQQNVVANYQFNTTGEHIVKYTLVNQTSIDGDTFFGCSELTSVTIPDGVTSIGDGAFINCSSLTSVTIPNSVEIIGDDSFRDCSSLASVTIPNSVTSIGESAFRYCSSLTSVTIGNSVIEIGDGAFRQCSNLTSITCNATTAPTISNNTFQEVNTNGTLTVPVGSTGYNDWMGTGNYYLGKYGWEKEEQ